MLAYKDVQNNSNSYTVPYFSIRHMKYLSKSKDDQQLVLAKHTYALAQKRTESKKSFVHASA